MCFSKLLVDAVWEWIICIAHSLVMRLFNLLFTKKLCFVSTVNSGNKKSCFLINCQTKEDLMPSSLKYFLKKIVWQETIKRKRHLSVRDMFIYDIEYVALCNLIINWISDWNVFPIGWYYKNIPHCFCFTKKYAVDCRTIIKFISCNCT